MSEPVVTQVEEGYPIEVTNRYGDKRTIKVGRVWTVEVGGREIGRMRYDMITRERRGKGLRYVFARWRSPGWERRETGDHYWSEGTSKKRCIESLVWSDERKGVNRG